jgi:hypothetical protein
VIYLKAMTIYRTTCFTLENQMKFVTEDLTDADHRWRAETNPAPAIGWIVGHVLIMHEQIINQLMLGGSPILPDDYYSTFGFATEGDFPSTYTLDDLFIEFKNVNSKIVESLMVKEDDWLDEFPDDTVLPPHWKNKNHMKVLALHFNHVFTHAGQILEIKRQLNKGAWGF